MPTNPNLILEGLRPVPQIDPRQTFARILQQQNAEQEHQMRGWEFQRAQQVAAQHDVDRQRAEGERQTLNQAFGQRPESTDATGMVQPAKPNNRAQAHQIANDAGQGHLSKIIDDTFDSAEKADGERRILKEQLGRLGRDALGTFGASMTGANANVGLFLAGIEANLAAGNLPPAEGAMVKAELEAAANANDEGQAVHGVIQRHSARWIINSPFQSEEQRKREAGANNEFALSRIAATDPDPAKREAAQRTLDTYAQTKANSTKPAVPSQPGSPADYLSRWAKERGKDVKDLTTAEVNTALKQHTDATQKTPMVDDAAVSLSPEGLALTAHQYAMTGQLPPMGMGKPAALVRTKIINEAAKIYVNLDLPSQVAAFKANQQSLTKLQGTSDALKAFEETAIKNLDVFLSLAGKIPDTGSPLLNRPLRAINEKMLGGVTLAAFNTARQTVIPEFAKILSNPGLSGQLTDSARKDIEAVVSGDASLAQLIASGKILKLDAANRRTSYDQQIADVQKRIATPPRGTSSSAPASPMSVTVTSPSGKVYPFPDQAAADRAVAAAKAAGLWK